MDAVLNYDSLSRILNKQVSGKEFDLSKGPVKKKFVIQNCSVYGGNGDKLIIKVIFSGTDNGTLYLVGKPIYDPSARILKISDIDFDIRSKDALLKAADWLFNRKIINEISHYAQYDLGAYIDTAKNKITEQLNMEWIKGVRGVGRIDDLKLMGIFPFSQFLVIRSNCTGNLSVRVDAIPFSL